MKKRILSLMLVLAMCLSIILGVPATYVSAATTEEITSLAESQNFSDWAMMDLVVGDTYGIYPLEWYYEDMTAPITRPQLRTVIGEVRVKLFDTDEVTGKTDQLYRFEKNTTVEKALEYFYQMLSEFTFTTEIGLKDKTALEFMMDNGIYTGSNGEQALTDLCSIEQACVIGARVVTYVFDKQDAGSKGFFWKTQSGENTVYLLGSIHMASSEVYPLNSEILSAFASADALAVEVNLYDTVGAMKLAQLGMYSDGTTLKDHVSEATYKKTIELAAMYGYPEEMIAMCKPWYLYSTFAALAETETGDTAEAAEAVNLGIDINFTTNALITGKQIFEIEGYEYQGQVLDSFSDELEEYLLISTIDSIYDMLKGTSENESADELAAMLQLWHEGDIVTYQKETSFESEYPDLTSDESAVAKALISEFKDKLLTQRDKGMADYIGSLLKSEGSNTYFVIVGSSHYISDYDVIDLLEEKGYEVTQIK